MVDQGMTGVAEETQFSGSLMINGLCTPRFAFPVSI